MEMLYTKYFELTDLYVDCHRRLKNSVLLYLVQEVSTDHAKLLGSDWETLHDKNLFWAIIRQKVKITRLPEAGETIRLETWPLPATRVAYPRATVAYDAEGKELFRTMALWVLMDMENRSMVLPGKSGVDVPGIVRGLELDAPGSLVPKPLANTACHTVHYGLLDRNGHMNNTRYLDWVDDLLNAQFHKDHPVRDFTVCYLAEAREGQEVMLHWELSPEGVLRVEANRLKEDQSGRSERVFAAQVQF